MVLQSNTAKQWERIQSILTHLKPFLIPTLSVPLHLLDSFQESLLTHGPLRVIATFLLIVLELDFDIII